MSGVSHVRCPGWVGCQVSAPRGGIGGGLPVDVQRNDEERFDSGTEQKPFILNPQAESASTPVSIDAALCAAGVFVLAAARRRACADALSLAGLTATDVADLADFIGQSESDESRARRYLASTVSDPDRAKEAVDDFGQFKESRAASKAQHKRGPMPTMPWHDLECSDDTDADQKKSWQVDRLNRIAFCRVVADRQPVEDVAREMSVTVPELQQMVKLGRQLSADLTDPSKRCDESETQEERTKRFIADMKARRVHA